MPINARYAAVPTAPTAAPATMHAQPVPHGTVAISVPLVAPAGVDATQRPDRRSRRDGRSRHAPGSLPSRLNQEWRRLCSAADADDVLARWASAQPALAAVGRLEELPRRVSTATPAGRDGLLLALLRLAQDGDQLAGRAVLQVMLPKAVRLAVSVTYRPDIGGDREEAHAVAVAALWQVIAGYPVARRPRRVTANLAMDTLAVVQRGHTGSSHLKRTYPERPCGDLRELSVGVHRSPEPDELTGPVDAQLLMLLAWAVRNQVLTRDQARMLARAYGADGRPAATSATVAAEFGLSAAALRQRCHRLARQLGQAALRAGITCAGDPTDPAVAA